MYIKISTMFAKVPASLELAFRVVDSNLISKMITTNIPKTFIDLKLTKWDWPSLGFGSVKI